MGGICRHDLSRADLGCLDAPRIIGWAFVALSGASIIWIFRRLSNSGICADGAKRGGVAHQSIRHLSVAYLEGEGMKRLARRPADPAPWVNRAWTSASKTPQLQSLFRRLHGRRPRCGPSHR